MFCQKAHYLQKVLLSRNLQGKIILIWVRSRPNWNLLETILAILQKRQSKRRASPICPKFSTKASHLCQVSNLRSQITIWKSNKMCVLQSLNLASIGVAWMKLPKLLSISVGLPKRESTHWELNTKSWMLRAQCKDQLSILKMCAKIRTLMIIVEEVIRQQEKQKRDLICSWKVSTKRWTMLRWRQKLAMSYCRGVVEVD